MERRICSAHYTHHSEKLDFNPSYTLKLIPPLFLRKPGEQRAMTRGRQTRKRDAAHVNSFPAGGFDA